MNTSSLYRRRWQNRERFPLWQQTALMVVLLFLIGGCADYRKQIRDYISGQEQVVAFPLRQVMLASGKGLEDQNLAILELAFTQHGGLMQARDRNREATLVLDQVGPRSTRVHIDVYTREGARDISSEEALMKDVHGLLNHSDLPSLQEMTAKMIPVHQSPDPGSRMVAYLAKGAVVQVRGDHGEWSDVALLSGGTGYIASRNLHPAPNSIGTDIP